MQHIRLPQSCRETHLLWFSWPIVLLMCIPALPKAAAGSQWLALRRQPGTHGEGEKLVSDIHKDAGFHVEPLDVAGACDCGHCMSERRLRPTAVSARKCAPKPTIDESQNCMAPPDVVTTRGHDGIPYVLFCLCHCQPFGRQNSRRFAGEVLADCVGFSDTELRIAAGDGDGNCQDPKLPTQIDQAIARAAMVPGPAPMPGPYPGAAPALALAPVPAPASFQPEAPEVVFLPPSQKELLKKAKEALKKAKQQFEAADVARENSGMFRDQARTAKADAAAEVRNAA